MPKKLKHSSSDENVDVGWDHGMGVSFQSELQSQELTKCPSAAFRQLWKAAEGFLDN
jgi:hypothetical protein